MTVALVTGATGQDGYYLCRVLGGEGTTVCALVRPEEVGADDPALAELLSVVPGLQVRTADLADAEGLRRVVDDVAPDEIYNLGGISSVALSWQQPLATGVVTGLAVATLLDAAVALQERTGRQVRLVQASSAEIFGNAATAPQDERTPVVPRNPYGAAKAYAHHMVGTYRARGLHASTTILYNHESPRRPPSFVTRKVTLAAARIAAGLQDELVLGSLDVRRDWGWAPDYVRAMHAALRASEPDDYVIATGVAHTVGELVETAFTCAGVADWRSHVRSDPRFVRPVETALQVGDPTKARTMLDWEPSLDFAGLVGAMVEHDLALASDEEPRARR